jgi:hypothetical protein
VESHIASSLDAHHAIPRPVQMWREPQGQRRTAVPAGHVSGLASEPSPRSISRACSANPVAVPSLSATILDTSGKLSGTVPGLYLSTARVCIIAGRTLGRSSRAAAATTAATLGDLSATTAPAALDRSCGGSCAYLDRRLGPDVPWRKAQHQSGSERRERQIAVCTEHRD